MNSLAIFTSLLALASAMQPEPDYERFVNTYHTLYRNSDRIGFTVANDAFSHLSYGIIQTATHPKRMYQFALKSDQEWNQSKPRATTLELEPDWRLTMNVNGNVVELRAIKNGEFWELHAVDANVPLGKNDYNRFAVLCQDAGYTTKCIIELIGPMVSYRRNNSDMRPLVIDRGGAGGSLVLWAKNGFENQVFGVGADRPRSFLKQKFSSPSKTA